MKNQLSFDNAHCKQLQEIGILYSVLFAIIFQRRPQKEWPINLIRMTCGVSTEIAGRVGVDSHKKFWGVELRFNNIQKAWGLCVGISGGL